MKKYKALVLGGHSRLQDRLDGIFVKIAKNHVEDKSLERIDDYFTGKYLEHTTWCQLGLDCKHGLKKKVLYEET